MNDTTRSRIWKWSLISLFGASSLVLPAGGYWLYRREVQAIRSDKESELRAVAELKAKQIAKWRSELASDTRVHSKRTLLRSAVGRWLKGSDDVSVRTEVEASMELVRSSYGYENVIVAGMDGEILFSLNPRLTELEATARNLIACAVSSRAPVFGDLFRCPTCNEVHLDVAATILGTDSEPAAVLILRSDPGQHLYPLIQSWPTPSRSAETLLVRRDGENVLFLNQLRHQPHPALTLRIPLSRADVPAVQAALGQAGEFDGKDYCGVPVLAEILPVPGSPWFMVAKVDTDEILAEARYRGQFILLFTAVSMLLAAAVAAFAFSRQHRILYRDLFLEERQRRRVEEELHATFYSIGDAVISTDAEGHVTRMNAVAERLTGWSEAEAMGKPSQEVFRIANEETRAEVESPVARVLHEGVVVNLANHTLLLSRDGAERPIADSGAPICDEQGHITGAVLVFRDQTEDRRVQVSLRELADRFRMLVENTQDVFMRVRPDGTVDYCSPAVAAFGGYTAEEEIGQHVGKYFADPQQMERAMAVLAEAIATRDGRSVELLYQPKTGVPFWVEVSGKPMVENGEVTAVHCIMRDIRARKKVEEALRESQEEFQSIISLAQDAIISVDPQGCISLWNGAAERVFGYSAEEVLGQNLHNLLAPARLREAHQRGYTTFLRSGKGAAIGKVLELPALHKNGNEFPIELSLASIQLRGQWHAVGVVRDVTERGRAQEELRRYAAALEAANERLKETSRKAESATRAKTEFLANMSHEIRTPMTAILGYTELLMDDSLGTADRKTYLTTYLTTVRRNADHLLQLINDILDLSKIEAGKMVMDLEPCHLLSAVADVASMMRPRAEQHGSTLEVRYTGPLPQTIRTDGTRLRQVIVNLVGNAVKFTENGSIRVSVSFLPQWRSDQSAVSVAVADTGIGISQEAQTRLFQPFTQAETSTTRKYGGTGLGLAISREIIAALGGELTFESTAGEGSTFTVTIPAGDISEVNLVQSAGDVICEDEAGARWTPVAGVLRGVQILLAEDSVDNQELLRAVLGGVGAEVEVVENGRLAVERAQAGSFDVVLMDMNMPEMDGYEASRRLRDRGYTRPILALTANAMSGDADRCLAAGCNAHLAKPIDRKQLILAVAHHALSETGHANTPTANPSLTAGLGQSDGIVSQFADDPQLAGILPGFVQRLSTQLDALCKALEEESLEDAERLAHRLKAAGGSYGYPTLSEAAKSLELAVKAQDTGGATAAMAEIKGVCAAIQLGWNGHARETTLR